MRVSPIGSIRFVLKRRASAPRQGSEGAPDAWLDVIPEVADGLQGITAGDEIILLTWLHKSQRNSLKTHPRSDKSQPLTGVFATRSPDHSVNDKDERSADGQDDEDEKDAVRLEANDLRRVQGDGRCLISRRLIFCLLNS